MCQKCLIFTDNEICLIENSFVDSGNKFKRHRNKKEFFFFLMKMAMLVRKNSTTQIIQNVNPHSHEELHDLNSKVGMLKH